jgi:hypothetical protein
MYKVVLSLNINEEHRAQGLFDIICISAYNIEIRVKINFRLKTAEYRSICFLNSSAFYVHYT